MSFFQYIAYPTIKKFLKLYENKILKNLYIYILSSVIIAPSPQEKFQRPLCGALTPQKRHHEKNNKILLAKHIKKS